MATSPPEEGQTLVEMLLEDLRWGPDQAIVNYFGESVWLKQVWHEGPLREEERRFGYITDCCFTDDPCLRHTA